MEIIQSWDNGLVNVWDGELRAHRGALIPAHLSHPLRPEDFARLASQNPRVMNLIGRKTKAGEPGLMKTLAQPVIDKLSRKIYGKTDLQFRLRRTTGIHVLLPYYPEDLMRVRFALMNLQPRFERGEHLSKDEQEELRFANEVSSDLLDLVLDLYARGVRVISFGGYLSIAMLNCKWIFRKLRELGIYDLIVTPGSYGTAESIRQMVHMLTRKCGIVPRQSRLVIIGCSGAIMRIVNQEIVPMFRETILVGRDPVRSERTRTGIIGLYEKLTSRVTTMPTERINEAIALGDLIVSAVNEADAVKLNIQAGSFKDGTAILDASLPSAMTPEVAALKRILAVQTGNFHLPVNCQTDPSSARIIGFEHPQQAHPCFSEACMWALLGRWGHIMHTLKQLDEQMLVKDVYDMKMFRCVKLQFRKFGFKLDSLRSAAGELVQEEDFARIRQLRQESSQSFVPRLAEGY